MGSWQARDQVKCRCNGVAMCGPKADLLISRNDPMFFLRSQRVESEEIVITTMSASNVPRGAPSADCLIFPRRSHSGTCKGELRGSGNRKGEWKRRGASED